VKGARANFKCLEKYVAWLTGGHQQGRQVNFVSLFQPWYLSEAFIDFFGVGLGYICATKSRKVESTTPGSKTC